MRKMRLVGIYYELSELLGDDVECVADAILHFTHTEYRRSVIRNKLEYLRLHAIESELLQLREIKRDVLVEYYKFWELKSYGNY